jgi:protein gp37
MADRSSIEWTDATWNPIRGCTRVSEGCRNCYAESVAARWSDPGAAYHGFADRDRPGSKWTGRVELAEKQLDQPLRWKRPRRIFVNSMSDLFHEALPDEAIDRVFAIMGASDDVGLGHTFQILTKRSARMLEYMQVHARAAWNSRRIGPSIWPPRNVWLGVSVEDQTQLAIRGWHLSQVAATARFYSYEPALGPLDPSCITNRWGTVWNALTGRVLHAASGPPQVGAVHWVIAGGESGNRARPMDPKWARSLRDQCAAAGVPFFFKQWGSWVPDPKVYPEPLRQQDGLRHWGGSGPYAYSWRTGYGGHGAQLDGIEHKAFPA